MSRCIPTVALLLIMTSVSRHITSALPAPCQSPNNQQVSYRNLIQNGSGLNAFLYPAIFVNETEVSEDALQTQCLSHSRRDSCPDHVLVGEVVPVSARSTCPWIYRVDHNPQRFPSTLLVAKALCQYCIGSNGDMECHPIIHTIPVFRQGECVEGFYQYYKSTEDITTGFTCTGKRTHQVPTDDHEFYA